MKKIIVWMLALALVLCLGACGSPEMRTEAPAPAATAAEAAAEDAAPAAAAAKSAEKSETADTSMAVMDAAPAEEAAPAAEAAEMPMPAPAVADMETLETPEGEADVYEAPMPDTMPEGEDPTQARGDPFVLTAGEWRDLDNWPFFLNLVNSGTIQFPVYGLDPTAMTRVTVTDPAGNPVRDQTVELLDGDGNPVFSARTDKTGAAYLFGAGVRVRAGAAELELSGGAEDPQSGAAPAEDLALTVPEASVPRDLTQVMFILDTTGSMADEIAYLQQDFASIAEEVGGGGVLWSAGFYRDQGDEYVTRLYDFTADVSQVRSQIAAEYADGGGDTPEAVAEALQEAITWNEGWREDAGKLAFLIFDAPPHEGREQELQEAVRSAAARGIRLYPVVASNAQRETELFGRALAICTGGSYVFLTDDSGVGNSHLEPIVGDYNVELLHDVIVRIIRENME